MRQSPDGVQTEIVERGMWARAWDALQGLALDRRFVRLALLAIVVLGASMRLANINWDSGTHLHPDERFLTFFVVPKLDWPKSLAEYFDEAKSPLNPYNRGVDLYVYGDLPIFIVKAAFDLLKDPQKWPVHFVGRTLSAIYDLIVVVLAFAIGRRLYGKWAGLLAALLMSCTVLNIQHSHFFVVEPFITLMATVALYFAVRAMQEGRWTDWVLLGASFGMAVAGKISMALFGLVMGVACLLRALREPAIAEAVSQGSRVIWRWTLGRLLIEVRTEDEEPGTARALAVGRNLAIAAAGLALALVAAVIAFRITQPYAFAGPSPFSLKLAPRWLKDMGIASRTLSGAVDMPPSHQWTDREPIWFAWRNMVLWGMGLPLGLAAWAGWLVAWVEVLRKRHLDHLLLLVWVTFTFAYQSVQFVKTMRYFLPIYPALVVLAAYFLVWLWRQARRLAAGSRDGGVTQPWSPARVEVGLGPKSAPGWRRWAPHAAGLVGALVVVGTFLYAEAFTNIYRRPLSRVTASRWVYDNIPKGSALAWEVWDDIVPVNIDGKDAGQWYRQIKTEPYGEDMPEKLEAIIQWLDESDYVIFSSNRVYDSIPRLPERFPLTTAYYKYMFSGELGFETIKVFTSYPNLGPIQFVDDIADEAFTVYDHPKVTILKKTPAYSSAKARALLGEIPVDRLVRLSPVQTMRARHGLMLTAEEREVQQEGGTWSEIFGRGSLANRLPVPAWLIVLELLGLAAFPLAFVAFRSFRDRGFIFAKTLGVLIVTYLAWLVASLHWLPYTRLTIAGAAALLLIAGLGVAWWRWHEVYAFARREWRTLLLEEGLFLAFFGAFLLVRFGNPDLWHPAMGGEKPMDLAYLNAIIKSTWFPPYDPWFAGGYINYYYFGQVVVATLVKFSGVVPEVAYNLALPTLFALTAMGGYAVVNALVGWGKAEPRPVFDRAARFGLFGALLIAVLGNLGQVRLYVNGLWEASQYNLRSTIPGLEGLAKAVVGLYQVVIGGRPLNFRPEWWYWNASRVMGKGEINEFPYFTFLYADLHAHLIALPFALLALGLIVSLLLWTRRTQEAEGTQAGASDVAGPLYVGKPREGLQRWAGRVDWGEWLALGLLALTVGELRVNNTWDWPTYLMLALAGLVLGRLLRSQGIAWREAWPVLVRFGTLALVSTLLYQPFHGRYGAAYTSVELWKGPRTEAGDYLVVHGVFLFILASYVLDRAFGYQARGALARSLRLTVMKPLRLGRFGELAGVLTQPTASYQFGWLGIVFALGLSALAVLAGWWLVGLVLPLGLVALAVALRRDLGLPERLAALLFAGGLVLTLAVEAIVLKGDIGRMNTVFKFYLQVWVLWGVAAAVGLAVLWERKVRWSPRARSLWQVGLGLLVFGAALYPLTATWGKINDRFDRRAGPSLDGTAYAASAVYHDQGKPLELRHDMAAIRWLQENVKGSPVILEANTPLYRWGSRISIYTGLPTVIGWDWHQKQQRAVVSGDVVEWRLADVRTLYNGTNEAETVKLLKLYDVSYVYVGELERAYYAPEGLAKFDRLSRLFEVVYDAGPVRIYRVRKEELGRGLALSSQPPFVNPRG